MVHLRVILRFWTLNPFAGSMDILFPYVSVAYIPTGQNSFIGKRTQLMFFVTYVGLIYHIFRTLIGHPQSAYGSSPGVPLLT